MISEREKVNGKDWLRELVSSRIFDSYLVLPVSLRLRVEASEKEIVPCVCEEGKASERWTEEKAHVSLSETNGT